jgi:protein-disulfide isomerase
MAVIGTLAVSACDASSTPPHTSVAVRGADDAPIQIVELMDYECGFCRKSEATIERIFAEYPGQVRVTVVSFPLPSHENAELLSRAAYAAAAQNKWLAMHQKLLATTERLDAKSLDETARSIGLDVERFRRDLDAPETHAAVAADRAYGEKLEVKGTPTFFINGKRLIGAQPYESFKKMIDDDLRAMR